MSKFIVTFADEGEESYRGWARHVASGEEARFSSITELLLFFDEMNAMRRVRADAGDPPEGEGVP